MSEQNTAHGNPMPDYPPPHPFDGQFEPAAEAVAKDSPHIPLDEIAAASLAISMKRIADAITSPTNEYGETAVEALGGNLRRALMGWRS